MALMAVRLSQLFRMADKFLFDVRKFRKKLFVTYGQGTFTIDGAREDTVHVYQGGT